MNPKGYVEKYYGRVLVSLSSDHFFVAIVKKEVSDLEWSTLLVVIQPAAEGADFEVDIPVILPTGSISPMDYLRLVSGYYERIWGREFMENVKVGRTVARHSDKGLKEFTIEGVMNPPTPMDWEDYKSILMSREIGVDIDTAAKAAYSSWVRKSIEEATEDFKSGIAMWDELLPIIRDAWRSATMMVLTFVPEVLEALESVKGPASPLTSSNVITNEKARMYQELLKRQSWYTDLELNTAMCRFRGVSFRDGTVPDSIEIFDGDKWRPVDYTADVGLMVQVFYESELRTAMRDLVLLASNDLELARLMCVYWVETKRGGVPS